MSYPNPKQITTDPPPSQDGSSSCPEAPRTFRLCPNSNLPIWETEGQSQSINTAVTTDTINIEGDAKFAEMLLYLLHPLCCIRRVAAKRVHIVHIDSQCCSSRTDVWRGILIPNEVRCGGPTSLQALLTNDFLSKIQGPWPAHRHSPKTDVQWLPINNFSLLTNLVIKNGILVYPQSLHLVGVDDVTSAEPTAGLLNTEVVKTVTNVTGFQAWLNGVVVTKFSWKSHILQRLPCHIQRSQTTRCCQSCGGRSMLQVISLPAVHYESLRIARFVPLLLHSEHSHLGLLSPTEGE